MIITKRVNISSLFFFSFPFTEAVLQIYQEDWRKPFSLPHLLLFCSVSLSSLHSHCLSISPEDSTFFKLRKKKLYVNSLNTFFVCDRQKPHASSVWRLPDTYLFRLLFLLFYHSPSCEAGREDEMYLWRSKGEKALYAHFTSLAQLNTGTGHTLNSSEKRKKKKQQQPRWH